jgi:hypothetical protein
LHIWIVNQYADPPDGLATRSFDLSRRWVEKGNPTTIFTSNFSHYYMKPMRRIPPFRLWLDVAYAALSAEQLAARHQHGHLQPALGG